MPGGRAVIVLKATRPTASCLARWVRTPGVSVKKAWEKNTAISEIRRKATAQKTAAGQAGEGFSGWAEREKPGGAKKSFAPRQRVIFFFSFLENFTFISILF